MIKKKDIESVAQAAEADADMDLPGLRESLNEMVDGRQGKVHTPEQILVREARTKLGLSQSNFANLIKTPVGTVRDWEQGRFKPPGGIQCLLHIAIKHPDVVRELAA